MLPSTGTTDSHHTMFSLLLFSLLLYPAACLEAEEQSLVKVFSIRDYPRVALLRWKVPTATVSATFTFFANVSSGCDANIKM